MYSPEVTLLAKQIENKPIKQVKQILNVSDYRAYKLLHGEYYRMTVAEFDILTQEGLIRDKSLNANTIKEITNFANKLDKYSNEGNLLRLGEAIKEFKQYAYLLECMVKDK